MVPLLAGKKRVKRLKQVVLPAPLGPISAWMVPRVTRRSTRLTAMNPRNSFDSPRVSRMTSGSGTRLLSRKAASLASTGALERCDPGAASPAFRLTFKGDHHMNAFLRTLCLAALLAAGSAWAQQSQSDNPQNPHSTTAKDKQSTGTPSSATNEQVDQNEKVNPHHPDNRNTKPSGTATNEQIDAAERGQPHHVQNKDRDKLGEAGQTGTMAGQTDQMADMDHDAMMKNATPQMMLQRMHMSNLHEIEMGKIAEQN